MKPRRGRKANDVPLICNEFGVYRESPTRPRAWPGSTMCALRLKPMASAGRCGIITNGFGVAVKDTNGKSVVDPDTVRALGLKGK